MSTLLLLIGTTLRAAAPLLLTALGGVFSERSGVINIGLEGTMLMGAWGAVYFSLATGSAWVGVLGAILMGVIIAALHAVASIQWRANQVVVGVAINLLASGFTEFMAVKLWSSGQSPEVPARVPDVGPLNLFVYLAFGLALFAQWLIYRTPWGLRLRAVGEHPKAADTVGVSVYRMRYWGVLLSGVFAGLGGATLSVGLLSRFTVNMTSGQGFIALAAMIFGRWNPVGAIWACLLFGVAGGLATLLQIWGVPIPSQFLLMAPYVLTMLALAGFVGRAMPPAADGVPYEKGH
jgi:general nucleoside transport system permease protein